MAYVITVSKNFNNSLGNCWLCKLEDDFTGELLDKCLYPMSDGDVSYALEKFIDLIGSQDLYEDVDEIMLLDDIKDEDSYARFFAETFKSRYGVEYRSMSNALHNIIVCEDEESADELSAQLDVIEDDNEDYEYELNSALENAVEIFEIDYRDVEEIADGNGQIWRYYDDGDHGVLLVNYVAYDLYI